MQYFGRGTKINCPRLMALSHNRQARTKQPSNADRTSFALASLLAVAKQKKSSSSSALGAEMLDDFSLGRDSAAVH
jgi:hypothetical protein